MRSKLTFLGLSVLIGLGCSSSSSSSDKDAAGQTDVAAPSDVASGEDGSQDTGDPPSCVGLDAATCGATTGCNALFYATQLCAAGEPDDFAEYGGCAAATECGEATTCAAGPNGAYVAFSSTCLPDGWTASSSDACCPLPADWDTCEVASDCVAIETECCDHCNGGQLLSVNKKHEADAKANFSAQLCEGVACTEIACWPAVGTCQAGKCGWDDKGPTPSCSELGQDACTAEASCAAIMGAPAEEYCVDNFDNWMSIFAGCMDGDMGCGEAETCAKGPDGTALAFPNTCLPAGWSAASQEECCADTPPPPSYQTCDAAEQCVVLEMGCCDHCNGGWLMSVNSAFQEAALEEFKDDCSDPVACTEKGCASVAATCDEGLCGWKSEPFPGTTCADYSQNQCTAGAGCTGILGAPAAEVCAGNYDNWMTLWSGCMSNDVGCGDAETCALSPDTGEFVMFSSTCIPTGWEPVEWETCCKKAGPGPDPNEWTDCKVVADCKAIEMGCCDHCNGGFLMSVNSQYSTEAKAKYQETGCEQIACTQIACFPTVETCEQGTCGWKSL